MSLFESILQIYTKKKEHQIQAVFVPKSVKGDEWTYYVYYYDFLKNTFYINDLDCTHQKWRASALSIIEKIVFLAYQKELKTFESIVELFPKNITPKVYLCHRQKTTNIILWDKITLIPIKNKRWEIKGFKYPLWDIDWCKKYS